LGDEGKLLGDGAGLLDEERTVSPGVERDELERCPAE
jgi:hypothetical protein